MAITDFYLLLLDDNRSRRESMLRAAQRAGLMRVHALPGAGQARTYLEQAARRASEHARFPSLLLLNLDDPSGIEILSWLRSRPDLRRIVTIGLLDGRDGQILGRAHELHVNSCIVRPEEFDGQVSLFRSLREYWGHLNESPSS